MPTVEKGRELWFLGLFLVQYVGGLALIYWLGLRTGELKFLEAGALATALIIMSTAHAVVIVEGIAMLAESFLRRRYEAGLQEGRAEGHEAGLQAGREEGREAGLQAGREEGREAGLQAGREEGREMLRHWEEWNRRRIAAESRGERFEEPPPGE